MEIEVLSLDAGSRPSALTQLKSFRSEFGKLKQDFERAMLFSGTPEDMEAGIFSPTDRLLNDYEGLDASGQRLDRTQRMALEAEEIGANVLGDLRRQREQIQRASRVLHETDNDLDHKWPLTE
ncbi:hypothetical protein PSACC_03468 [Paramicrosporidium saccamoebae]|uniref:Uncharacterized protein n=1 Tax=Paramicrosporidium saccamoebae TaxID=1246581 RepID=A0A2H9TG90_9FUNG|nr:hypothetical protein PSACC_03468 [Paramicrosporidium saccamoebae]